MIRCDSCSFNFMSIVIKIWKGYALCPECLKMQSGTTAPLFDVSTLAKKS